MSSNAQRDLYMEPVETQAGSAGELRRLAGERLAAHRARRLALDPASGEVAKPKRREAGQAESTAARRVREAVAARYSETPSYKEFMAAEAEQAVQRAQAEVALAERTAQAVVEAQSLLLRELERWPEQEPQVFAPVELEVRHVEALPVRSSAPSAMDWMTETADEAETQHHHDMQGDEMQALNEEIAFRLEPEFDVHLLEPLPIQANIIEFPRQLVAAKKARPRLAEGPLRSDDDVAEEVPPTEFQMRIFEVEREIEAENSEATVEAPAAAEVTVAAAQPEWQRLVLDAVEEEDEAPSWSVATTAAAAEMESAMQLLAERPAVQPARRELWAMAVAVDALVVGVAFVALAAVTAVVAGAALPHTAKTLVIEGAVALLGLVEMYQVLFFWLGTTTPGMAYANLEFRSVDGGEPSRRAMRRRVWANVVAVAPAGVGVLWSVVDAEGLGWNDRLSGVYVREF